MKFESGSAEKVFRDATRVGLAAAVGLGLMTSCSRQTENKPEPVEAKPPPAVSRSRQPEVQPAPPNPEYASLPPTTVPSPAPPVALSTPQIPRTEPTPLTRQMVATLTQVDLAHGPLTPERAAAWKQTLKQLIEQGDSAVPAIREFLEKNTDVGFDAAGSSQLVGSATVRLALLDALQNIGGPEATAALLQTLQTTADPAELATLAKLLEKSEPEKYRAAVLSAAREALTLAASGQWDGREVSPLFEILKNYGGAQAAADLEKYANTWFDYTPLTLAELPDGAGIASLIRLAQNADGTVTLGHDIYQRVLAQAAAQFPAAADALVAQTRANRIGVSAWPGVAAALTGSTLHLAKPLFEPPATQPDTRLYHVSVGNQNYLEVPPPADLTANQIGDRIRLIDTLLGVTSNPAAIDALEGARIALAARQASKQ